MLLILKLIFWPIDETWSGTTSSGQKEPESNGNKGIVHTHQIAIANSLWMHGF